MRLPLRTVSVGILAVLLSVPARAQSDGPIGVRAAGMGGAFVAVADDASAIFWNPGGLASGAYFSAVIDRNTLRTADDAADPRSRSGLLFAISIPPAGLGYYRTHSVMAAPVVGTPPSARIRFDNLIAHHTGVTLVQTIAPGVSVGAAFKLVRGVASSVEADRVAGLDAAADLIGRASTKFDTDFGIMASTGIFKAGLTVRNAFEPSFAVPDGGSEIPLERRVRGGVALKLIPAFTLAADADFTRVATSGGHWRDAALGAEARLTARGWARAGVHWNTAGDPGPGSAPVASIGGSYAIYRSILAEGQVSVGSPNGDRGWGVGARIVF